MNIDYNIENARTGFLAAVNLWTNEANSLWSKFNAFLLVNSIVVGSISLLTNSQKIPPELFLIIPVIGVIFCFLWLTVTMRSFANHSLWIFSAREIEEKYLKDAFDISSRGGRHADGHEIHFQFGDANKHLQIPCLARWPIRCMCYLIIGLFTLLYIILAYFLYYKK